MFGYRRPSDDTASEIIWITVICLQLCRYFYQYMMSCLSLYIFVFFVFLVLRYARHCVTHGTTLCTARSYASQKSRDMTMASLLCSIVLNNWVKIASSRNRTVYSFWILLRPIRPIACMVFCCVILCRSFPINP